MPEILRRPLAVQLEQLARQGAIPFLPNLKTIIPSARKKRLLVPVGLKRKRH